MIARLWRGATPASVADEYVAYLERTGVRDYALTPGNQGVWVFRQIDGERAEFLLLSLWDSWKSIERFAGPDAARAVYYPEDARYLLDRDPEVRHFDLVARR